MIREDFLSTDNSEILFRVIKKHIHDRSGEDISIYDSFDIPNRLRGVMIKLYETTDLTLLDGSREENLINLNKKVVRACVPGFLQMLNDAKNNPRVKMNRVEERPLDTQNNYNNNNNNNNIGNPQIQDVNSQFEQLNQVRNNELEKRKTSPQVNFTEEINEEKYENPSVLFEKLEKNRNIETKQLLNQKNQETSSPDISSDPVSEQIPNNIHPSTISNTIIKEISQTIRDDTNKLSSPSRTNQQGEGLVAGSGEVPREGLQEEYLDGLQSFENKQKVYEDREKAFQDRLKRLQAVRENNFKEKLQTNENSGNSGNSGNGGNGGNSGNSGNGGNSQPELTSKLLDHQSIYQQRNQTDTETNSKLDITQVDPKQLFQAPKNNRPEASNPNHLPLNYPGELESLKISETRIGETQLTEVIETKKIKTQETNHILIVNAYDRKWYGDWIKDNDGNDILTDVSQENRYSFSIKFSPDAGETNTSSIKRNFKNVTNIEIIDVIFSTHDNPTYIGDLASTQYGRVTSSCHQNDPDNADSSSSSTVGSNDNSRSEVVDLDLLNEDDSKFRNETDHSMEPDNLDSDPELDDSDQELLDHDLVTKVIKNCQKTSLNANDILPYTNLSLQNYPYLLFNIREYSGDLYSTNSKNNNAVTRLIIAKHFYQSKTDKYRKNMSGFLLLKPQLPKETASLTFQPTPITSLDTLTFTINTPDGYLYANENPWNIDNLRIKNLKIRQDGQFPKIELLLEKTFIPTIYEIGDSLIIKSFQFLENIGGKTIIRPQITEFQLRLQSYLTSHHGVVVIDRAFNGGTHKQSCLPTDKYGFCNVLVVPFPIDMLQDYYDNIPSGCFQVGGCLLNKSIQPVVTLKITCENNALSHQDLVI